MTTNDEAPDPAEIIKTLYDAPKSEIIQAGAANAALAVAYELGLAGGLDELTDDQKRRFDAAIEVVVRLPDVFLAMLLPDLNQIATQHPDTYRDLRRAAADVDNLLRGFITKGGN